MGGRLDTITSSSVLNVKLKYYARRNRKNDKMIASKNTRGIRR